MTNWPSTPFPIWRYSDVWATTYSLEASYEIWTFRKQELW